tara:strand:- start:436 stop:2058 length:1623 start_codon:yes stop_codon:yes gene_type:complete
MQYTQEQYRTAIQQALVVGNQQAAEELAEEAAVLFPKGYQAPSVPYTEQVAQRAEEFSPLEILSKYPEEVRRRSERAASEYGPTIQQVLPIAASQAVRTGGELLVGGVNMLIPDAVREGFEEGWNEIKDAPGIKQLSEALGAGFEVYSEVAKENPRAAETFETYVDIGLVLAPKSAIDIAPVARKQNLLYNVSNRMERRAGIDKLMDPHFVGEQGFSENGFRSVGGPLDKTVYVPTKQEQIMRSTLETVEKLDPNKSYANAHTVVADEIVAESKKLQALIKQQGNPKFQRQELVDDMRDAFAGLKQQRDYIGLSADAQKKANEYASVALDLVGKQKPNALGLLQARKDFDEFVNFGGKKGALEPSVENAKGVAGRFVRNILNDKLKEITEGDIVHNSLDRSHNLYNAKAHLVKRRMGEADNRISRALQRVSKAANLPSTPLALYATLKTGAAAAAGATAGVGLGAGAVMGAGAGVSIYALLKTANKQTRLKYYSKLLSGIDKGLKAYQSDKNLLRELKADRAYIVYLMNEARQEEEQNGE